MYAHTDPHNNWGRVSNIRYVWGKTGYLTTGLTRATASLLLFSFPPEKANGQKSINKCFDSSSEYGV